MHSCPGTQDEEPFLVELHVSDVHLARDVECLGVQHLVQSEERSLFLLVLVQVEVYSLFSVGDETVVSLDEGSISLVPDE